MNWQDAITAISPHVVRIETPTNYGTGFLTFYGRESHWCGVATAAHVVQHADEWQQPIRIRSNFGSPPRFLQASERVIYLDRPNDSAVVLFFKGDLELPESPIALMPVGQPCGIGIDVGWMGFPNIEPDTLCFFAGTVSASQPARKSYLIDGVAINGVSGGPVFHCPISDKVQIIGSVTAYHANRAMGEALPGLLRAQDVSHFHDSIKQIRNLEEAEAQKREFEARAQAQAGTAPVMVTTVPDGARGAGGASETPESRSSDATQ